MTYERVVEIGNTVGQHELHFFSSFYWWQYILYVGLFFLITHLIVKFAYFTGEILIGLLIALMLAIIPLLTWGYKESKVDDLNIKEIAEYKMAYGDVYIKSLADVDRELLYLKIDNEADVSGAFMLGSGYIESDLMAIYSIIYKEGTDAIAQNIKVAPSLALSENEIPYIRFKELNSHLPHYEKGKYDIKLYLPKDYKFTDIK